jgi:hypothetical protein
MATEATTEAKMLRVQRPSQGLLPTSQVQVREREPLASSTTDFILLHNSADGSWAEHLAERLNGQRIGNCNLRLSLRDWNPAKESNPSVEKVIASQDAHFLGIVVSARMLREDWPAAQRAITSLRKLAPAERNIVAILKDNVTIPTVLRMGEWFDFRNEQNLEEGLSDLVAFLGGNFVALNKISSGSNSARQDSPKSSESVASSYSFGVSATKERILSNLLPVVELPKFVFSAETWCRTESELADTCAGTGPLPFLLKGSRVYTIEPLSQDSVFAPAVSNWNSCARMDFTPWLSTRDRAEWAIELLNKLFRHHAWKRGLRWDECTDQYYFPRTKPKSLWWETGGRTVSREVTAPHMGWVELENDARAEVQYGWKHQCIRAGFVQVSGNLFLHLEPSWLLTELDGKTPATSQPVAPAFSGSQQQERNGQVLRSLRFWSAVLAKGHHEIRINTGQAPLRTKLTPVSGITQFGIPNDQMDYDLLMLAEMEDDLLMPALSPLGQ